MYRISLRVNEISPLFIELNELNQNSLKEYDYWKEKARWIRFEEHAEEVIGRWSKPYVATLPNTAIDDLNDLVADGNIILDKNFTSLKSIAEFIGNELQSCFNHHGSIELFVELFCRPHLHHHEKNHKIKKSLSSHSINKQKDRQINQSLSIPNGLNPPECHVNIMFKENTRFKKKINTKSEGASILVMPLDFMTTTRLIFIRLEFSTELVSLFEVNIRTRFIVVIVGPLERKIQLYECGRVVSNCLADDICRELFYLAKTKNDVILTVKRFRNSTMVLPASEWHPKIRIEPPEKYLSKFDREKIPEIIEFIHDKELNGTNEDMEDITLRNSISPFQGLISDFERKIFFYKSDFLDCLNLQCIASIMYMYLVLLCSLVAFGGLLGQETNNQIATMECILAGSLCGLIFSIFSGQPLIIVTATGPVIIIESILKKICDQHNLDYMEFRLWTGLWTSLYLFLFVMFNLSFLVKFITRFTEECFASLVAVVFMIDALKMTSKLKQQNHNILSYDYALTSANFSNDVNTNVNEKYESSIFYFSLILFLITLFICFSLKSMIVKRYFSTKFREFISEFSVLIAIFLVSLLDLIVGFDTLKLKIPTKIEPSSRESWIIPFYSGKNTWNSILIAMIPALFLTTLIFMDQHITAVIANRKELKLKKSHGYHLDLLILCITILVSSIIGLPWFVAGTVLTVTHINSLKIMSKNIAPGERPVFTGIREQRGTTLIVSILIGLSVFLTPILSFIPMAGLYAIFMFMGITLLKNLQFYERISILFMPAKHQPDLPYLRHVESNRVNIFTIIQFVSTALLYLIKYIDNVAIFFPLLIIAICGIRKLLDYVFTQSELYWLDDLLPVKKQEIETIIRNEIAKDIETSVNNLKKNRPSINVCISHENDPTILFIDSFSRTNSKKSRRLGSTSRKSSLFK